MAERVCFLASAPNILLAMQVGRASLVSNPARLSMRVGGARSVGSAWARLAEIWSVGGTFSVRSVFRSSFSIVACARRSWCKRLPWCFCGHSEELEPALRVSLFSFSLSLSMFDQCVCSMCILRLSGSLSSLSLSLYVRSVRLQHVHVRRVF